MLDDKRRVVSVYILSMVVDNRKGESMNILSMVVDKIRGNLCIFYLW